MELLLRQHAVFNKELQVVPLFLELLPVALKDLFQPVGHLLGDVRRDLLHIGVALQIAPGHVQGNIGRIQHPMEQGQEFGNNPLYRVGHEYLVAVQLNLVLLDFNVVLDLGEIKNSREGERVVHIQVNVEQGVVTHGVQFPVESSIILILCLRRRKRPQGLCFVDDVVFVRYDLFAVFPVLLLAKSDLYGEESAILLQQLADLVLLQEFLAL